MTPTAAPPKFETWNPPGHSFRIEYSVAVLEQIREISVDGYHRVPHGGVETGGILFGIHELDLVRILAWRPIACSYARGPSFVLSEKDETALLESLASPPGDAEHGPLELVGWYRAHTRSEVLLADADVVFFDRFFPQPWQTGLIVRPASFNPTRAGFFFREPDGRIRSESSYLEFTLRPVIVDQMPPMPEALDAPGAPVALAAREEAQPEPALDPVSESPARVPRWILYAAGILLLAGAALGWWLLRPVHRNLILSASDTGGQLRITWDGAAAWIDDAQGGSVEIEDRGVRTEVKLTPADLHSGNLIYARQSGNVGVRMSVDLPGIRPVVETTRFLGPPAKETEPQPQTPAQPAATETRAEPPAARLPHAPLETPVVATVAKRPVLFHAPKAIPPKSSPAMPNMAPPAIDNLPVTPPAGLPAVIGQSPRVAPPVVIPRSAAAPAPAPASGRIMWTGRLGKNARLVIDRNRASSGSLTGALPAVAARVSAYPGDLTNGGITLFTADPKYAQPITEKAGAENGWNWTTYTLAPKRAGGIRVIEQPGPQNNYRLVLESDIPKLSVVMLVWRATQ